MKRLIVLIIFFIFLSLSSIVYAKSGCCSSHGGVDCSAGPQANGRVICNDGWTGSSCFYSEMVMCGGSSTYSAPIYTPPTDTPYIPPSTNTPVPTATPTSIPTPTPTPIPTNTPSPTPKTGVLGETSTKSTSLLDTLIGLGILGGMGYEGYRLVKKFRKSSQ